MLIVDRGRPVARLEPVGWLRSGEDSRLTRLVRDGIVRPAHRALPKALLAATPARARHAGSGVRAVLAERREGR